MSDLPGFIMMSVTPFNEDGSNNEGALREHLQFLAASGTAVCLASVGTGEGTQLTNAETQRVYELGAKAIGGQVGVGSTSRRCRYQIAARGAPSPVPAPAAGSLSPNGLPCGLAIARAVQSRLDRRRSSDLAAAHTLTPRLTLPHAE